MPPPARILVVDDDADSREALAEVLELSGYQAETAGDGVEALARLRSRALPDALVVDLRMPRMDGEALVAAMRAEPRLRRLPVVAMSGAVERGCPPGAFAIVHKPFSADELLDTLADALEAARAPALVAVG